MNCSECGKFMGREGIGISAEWFEAYWACVCGNKYTESTYVPKIFHRDAIALVQWGGNRHPIVEEPNAKYGVKEIKGYYLRINEQM